jgi:hypothetical protein
MLLKLMPIVMALMLAGCAPRQAAPTPDATRTALFDRAVSTAARETIEAEPTLTLTPTPPGYPRAPLYVASLLVPGDSLGGLWTPGSIYDLTQPFGGCGVYGGCWEDWPGSPDFGARLQLLRDNRDLGNADFLYYAERTAAQKALQAHADAWSQGIQYSDDPQMAIWMIAFDKFDAEGVGERAHNYVGYVLIDPDDTEVSEIQIVFIRCRAIVAIDLMFPAETSAFTTEDMQAREQEQAQSFSMVADFAREVDHRTAQLACASAP